MHDMMNGMGGMMWGMGLIGLLVLVLVVLAIAALVKYLFFTVAVAALLGASLAAGTAMAQDRNDQRSARAFVPPASAVLARRWRFGASL